ncbi:MAG: nickel-dependent lactate racemase [Planctomycetes bacterium]|nr:nickel-dependent lactate racemase [Planctomycetota bacterium]
MRIRLDYHRDGLEVEVPDANLMAVLSMNPAEPLENPVQEIVGTLRNPTGCAPLQEIAAGKKTACIVISDITRPVPNKLLLPPILAELKEAGLGTHDIVILIGTGLHRPNEGAELAEMVGRRMMEGYRFVNHVARDMAGQQYLGETPRGVPVHIDKTYMEADLKIVTGLIEPHLMAGYSGGRKGILPGIAGLESIRVWHSPKILESPKATQGIIEGNPVHEEAVAAAKMAGVDFIVNTVLNEKRRMLGIFSGDLDAAFAEGAKFCEGIAKAELPEPADVVVTSSAGYPLDTTYYQACKGLVGAMPAVKQGGTIILAAGMAQGIGGEEFSRLALEAESLEQFMQDIWRDDFFVIDQWQLEETGIVARHAEMWLYTDGLPKETQAKLFMKPLDSVEQGIELALQKHGPDAKIAVIPKGPYVIPFVKQEA